MILKNGRRFPAFAKPASAGEARCHGFVVRQMQDFL
jgi:hypothetical protein